MVWYETESVEKWAVSELSACPLHLVLNAWSMISISLTKTSIPFVSFCRDGRLLAFRCEYIALAWILPLSVPGCVSALPIYRCLLFKNSCYSAPLVIICLYCMSLCDAKGAQHVLIVLLQINWQIKTLNSVYEMMIMFRIALMNNFLKGVLFHWCSELQQVGMLQLVFSWIWS